MTFLINKRAKTMVRTPEAGTIQNISGNISPLFPPSQKAQAFLVISPGDHVLTLPGLFGLVNKSIKRKEQV
jgi:hypothetical protein